MKKRVFLLWTGLIIAFIYGCNPKGQIQNETVTDIDGNVYHTVLIGDQTWMIENLKVTHYRNGDSIPNITDPTEWSNLNSSAYCNFNNEPNNAEVYGRLYNWFAVNDSRCIAPKGWHIPTDAEWNILEKYLDSSIDTTARGSKGNDIGCKLKESGTIHWTSPNIGATNISNFTALPGSGRFMLGNFGTEGEYGHYWSSTEHKNKISAWCRDLYYKSKNIGRGNGSKNDGFSVRCIKDKSLKKEINIFNETVTSPCFQWQKDTTNLITMYFATESKG